MLAELGLSLLVLYVLVLLFVLRACEQCFVLVWVAHFVGMVRMVAARLWVVVCGVVDGPVCGHGLHGGCPFVGSGLWCC